jgi:hypothetical protein
MTTKNFRDNIPNADVPTVQFLESHGVPCKSALERFESGEWEDFGDVPEDAPTISIATRGGDAFTSFFYDGKNWRWTSCGHDERTGEYIDVSGNEWHLFSAIREAYRLGPSMGAEMNATLFNAHDYGVYATVYGR